MTNALGDSRLKPAVEKEHELVEGGRKRRNYNKISTSVSSVLSILISRFDHGAAVIEDVNISGNQVIRSQAPSAKNSPTFL